MTAIVRFEGRRYPQGFCIEERDPDKYEWHSKPKPQHPWLWLVARGYGRGKNRGSEPYVVEGTHNRLFLELANTEASPEGVLAFSDRWGMLERQGPMTPLHLVYDSIHEFKHAATYIASGEPKVSVFSPHYPLFLAKMFYARLELCRDVLPGDREPSIFLKASTLLDFCRAELMHLLDDGVEIRVCPNCGTLLAIGKVGKPPIYCSDACRVAMHRRHKKEQETTALRPHARRR